MVESCYRSVPVWRSQGLKGIISLQSKRRRINFKTGSYSKDHVNLWYTVIILIVASK